MRSYYQDEWVTIHHGDCREILPQLPDKSVDLVLTDPPYFNQPSVPINTRPNKTKLDLRAGEWDNFLSDEDYLGFIYDAIDKFMRCLKDNASIYLFTNDRYLSYIRHYLKRIGLQYASTICWHKTNPAPRFIRKAMFISSVEFICFAYKGKPIFNFQDFSQMHNFIETRLVQGKERLPHTTQKPVSLISHLILVSSDNDSLILDPFLGSGTTAYCAKKLNRKCIGIEIEERYAEIAAKRCSQMVLDLSSASPSMGTDKTFREAER